VDLRRGKVNIQGHVEGTAIRNKKEGREEKGRQMSSVQKHYYVNKFLKKGHGSQGGKS